MYRLILPYLFFMIPAVHADGLNDTGIGFCVDGSANTADCATVSGDGGAYPRQDARYGRDAAATAGQLTKSGGGANGFDFTPITNSGGILLTFSTIGYGSGDWACTLDNRTGLVWEVKTADGGLRDQSWTYTWYDSSLNYGGSHGTPSGGTCMTAGRCDTEKYVADVNATALCGHNNWRVPTLIELQGIVNYGRTDPAIDQTYFPNTPQSTFWTSSPVFNSGPVVKSSLWYVNFNNGFSNTGSFTDPRLLRLAARFKY